MSRKQSCGVRTYATLKPGLNYPAPHSHIKKDEILADEVFSRRGERLSISLAAWLSLSLSSGCDGHAGSYIWIAWCPTYFQRELITLQPIRPGRRTRQCSSSSPESLCLAIEIVALEPQFIVFWLKSQVQETILWQNASRVKGFSGGKGDVCNRLNIHYRAARMEGMLAIRSS